VKPFLGAHEVTNKRQELLHLSEVSRRAVGAQIISLILKFLHIGSANHGNERAPY